MSKRGLLAALALLVAGCAPSQAPPEAASLAKTEEIGRAAVQYAQCLRDNGYQVPDPTFNEDGLPVYGEIPGLVKGPEFDQIRQSCGESLNAALVAAGVPNRKEVNTDELLGFARCMREHGIDVPDPTVGEPLAIPKSAFTAPAWAPAKQACESLLPEHWRNVLDPPGGAPGGGK